jgi:hypothetical protein
LRKAGAEIVDPVVIPNLKALLGARARDVKADGLMFEMYFPEAMRRSPFAKLQWPLR